MICALIGDQTIRNLNEERLELRLRTLIEQEYVSAFVLGYFGPFERLALRVIRRLQQDYPLLDYTVILCGLRKERPAEPELDYLHTLYPQGCWLWPGRIGLTRKLCYLASASDMIAYYDDTEQRRAASWIRRAARRKRLDLNAFTTLVFYSMGYKLFTLRQASRRSWRINQKAPAVKVYMLYYEDTMQQKCLKLMASKLAVAGLIEGNFSEEGLAAMSDVQDMTSQMAKELMLGIRDNVEDIAAAFKKMAFENPDREVPEVPVEETSLPPESVSAMIEQPKRVLTAEQEEKLQAAMVQLEQQKAKRTKKTQQVENQLSLFDSVA